MSGSRLSRERLSIGTVFYYRDFEGHTRTKDRYFIVVGVDDTAFFCFNTSTSSFLIIGHPYLSSSVTPLIPNGSECFRKDCVVDCTELVVFDDILMSNYLNSGRVTVEGTLSGKGLKLVADVVNKSSVLDERERAMILASLQRLLEE